MELKKLEGEYFILGEYFKWIWRSVSNNFIENIGYT